MMFSLQAISLIIVLALIAVGTMATNKKDTSAARREAAIKAESLLPEEQRIHGAKCDFAQVPIVCKIVHRTGKYDLNLAQHVYIFQDFGVKKLTPDCFKLIQNCRARSIYLGSSRK